MKQSLFSASLDIIEELQALLRHGIPLMFRQPGSTAQPVEISGFRLNPLPPLLMIRKQKKFDTSLREGWLFYRKEGQVRAFRGVIVKNAAWHAALALPREIFQLQRRQKERVVTPEPSGVVFTLKERQRLLRGRVLDVSLEGAKVNGCFSDELGQGTVLGPLSFSLSRRFYRSEVMEFTAGEAVIAWHEVRDGKTVTMGLQLQTASRERNKLAAYIQERLEEDIGEEMPGNREYDDASVIRAPEFHRASERVTTCKPSRVLFTLSGSTRLISCEPLDVSLDGARLAGAFPVALRQGMKVGPLSFSLFRQFDPAESFSFTVAEATVAWVRKIVQDEDGQVGLRLHLLAAEKEELDNYIRLRSVEERAKQSGVPTLIPTR